MFGIKLKVLKRSGIFYDLNEAVSPPTFTSPLNGVIRGQPVFIAIFGIKSNVMIRSLRKYDITVVFLLLLLLFLCVFFLFKWIIMNPPI